MLTELRLRDFVIVESLELEFGPGFTVLSGETGAGKSILIDALGLALGARADATVVREGRPRADIVATFRSDAATLAWLAERALLADESIVMLRRVIDADGRSRAFINGHPATVTQLRELGDTLVEVHGQHASQSLLRPDGQRLLLDRFAGTDLSALSAAHGEWRQAERELEQAQHGERELELERDRLQWQLDELDATAPQEQEWEALGAEQRRLAHAASLIDGTRGLADALTESDEALVSRLQAMQQKLRAMTQLDSRLLSAHELLEGAAIQAAEAASLLADYADRIDLDPERLATVEQRISALHSLSRKLRLPPEQLSAEWQRLRERLAQIERSRDLERLQQQCQQSRARFLELAADASRARAQAANRLEQGVSERIARLGMQGGRLQIAIEATEPASHGCDRIEFRIAAHAGATPRSLGKVASGGELSRISLAITEWAAQANLVPTLIFDEADAGVGGAVAEVIGELMRTLGESRQVLCVTHLPQVAAKANQHLLVTKQQSAGSTVSHIERLDRNRRIEELARMLGGVQITATTRRHAREMLG